MKKTLLFLSFALLFTGCENFNTLTIVSSYPANHSSGIGTDASIEIEFSQDVDREDFQRKFLLLKNGSSLSGSFDWVTKKKFKFTPRESLENGVRYVIDIPREAMDVDGNKMNSEFLSDFYVGSDVEKPQVTSSTPEFISGGITNIATNQNIVINFNKSMDHISTQNAFSISPSVTGYFSWSNNDKTMTYILTSSMNYGVRHRVTINDNALDTVGNKLMSQYTVFFTTGNDFINPQVLGIFMAGDPTETYYSTSVVENISKNTAFCIKFSEAMKQKDTETSFQITPSVYGTLSWNSDGTILTFTPKDPLSINLNYVLKIDSSASDLNGRKTGTGYQIVVNINNTTDSLPISLDRIYLSNDGTFSNYIDSSSVGWPLLIDMGIPANPVVDADKDFYFKFVFSNDNGDVSIDPYSILENIYIEHFGYVCEPKIADVTLENSNKEIVVKVTPLPNKNLTAEITRMTITGGKNGVKDTNGNYMQQNYVFEFKGNQ